MTDSIRRWQYVAIKMELSTLPEDIQLELLSKHIAIAYLLSKTCKRYNTLFKSQALWTKVCIYAYDTLSLQKTPECLTTMDRLRLMAAYTNICICADIRLPPKQHRDLITRLMGYAIFHSLNKHIPMVEQDYVNIIIAVGGHVEKAVCYTIVLASVTTILAYR